MQRKWNLLCLLSFSLMSLHHAACSPSQIAALQSGNLNALIASVEIQNCPSRSPLGDTPFQAIAKDANGNTINAPIDFQSTEPHVAKVVNQILKSQYPGQTSITASSGGVASAPCDITVLPPASSKTVVQLTDNNEEDTWGQNNNWSMTSRGKILWQHLNQNGDVEIVLGDSNGNSSQLTTVPNNGDVDFMALGSGAGASDVLASWRENLNTTYVSNGAGIPSSLGKQTQEENSIANGCLFFRKGQPDNDILAYSPANGLNPISTAGDLFNPITSECKAVYELQQNGMSSLIYFDGMNETPFVSALPLFPRFDFREGRAVYAMGGDIFLYDTTGVNPQVVNITNNPGTLNHFPRTDGHSVVFTRNQNNFYDVVLYDIASGNSQVISTTGALKDGNSLRIDLKQVIWMEGADLYFYDGVQTNLVNPFPASSIQQPHLSDGIVTWFGPTGPLTDNEIFILK